MSVGTVIVKSEALRKILESLFHGSASSAFSTFSALVFFFFPLPSKEGKMWEASLWERRSTKVLSHRCDVSPLALVQDALVYSLLPVCGHPMCVSYKGTTWTSERSLPVYIPIYTHICVPICICTYLPTYIHMSVYKRTWSYQIKFLMTV